VGTNDQAIKVAGKHLSGVRNTFAPPDLCARLIEKKRLSSKFVDPHFKRNPRTCAVFEEQKSPGLSC